MRRLDWTSEEDELIRSSVQAHGCGRWREIAAQLPGRSGLGLGLGLGSGFGLGLCRAAARPVGRNPNPDPNPNPNRNPNPNPNARSDDAVRNRWSRLQQQSAQPARMEGAPSSAPSAGTHRPTVTHPPPSAGLDTACGHAAASEQDHGQAQQPAHLARSAEAQGVANPNPNQGVAQRG